MNIYGDVVTDEMAVGSSKVAGLFEVNSTDCTQIAEGCNLLKEWLLR